MTGISASHPLARCLGLLLLLVAAVVQGSEADLRYDRDYPVVGYSTAPTANAIARLQSRLDRGELQLRFDPVRGYLDSILQALAIDPASQTLVYSKTSLQIGGISSATPRAIYFNDDTYVAWVQGDWLLEIAAVDSALGAVFYTLPNRPLATVRFARETSRCLNCHDTFFMSGGGVPRFVFTSAVTGSNGDPLTSEGSSQVTDRTPLEHRWGGWYVTGQQGTQTHLGNILARTAADFAHDDPALRVNRNSLADLFDTSLYLSDKSDIVALLVMEHQGYVQNLITRLNFKARSALARDAPATPAPRTWAGLPPSLQQKFKSMAESVVRAMMFIDEAAINDGIRGSSGFDAWFRAQGPRDHDGRSLRELDLNSRLFRYPVSYLVYSAAFEGMPEYAQDYILRRMADILSGRDAIAPASQVTAADRKAGLEILAATKPAFARIVADRGQDRP
jgi:hypothetical protein